MLRRVLSFMFSRCRKQTQVMSLMLNVGQCGIQIGHKTLKNLQTHSNNFPEETSSYFLNCLNDSEVGNLYANCLLIDTEEKVVDSVQPDGGPGSEIRCESVISKTNSGSGNNWSLGFHKNASQNKDQILSKINKILENMDTFTNVTSIHSLAGGTGSGLGSKLSIWLHDNFGSKKLSTSVVVSPQKEGDICVQSFNSVLTLGNLESDVVLNLENDAYRVLLD